MISFFEKERSRHLKKARKQLTEDEKKARKQAGEKKAPKKSKETKEDTDKKGKNKLKVILKTPRTTVAMKSSKKGKSLRRPGTVKKLKVLSEKQKHRKAFQKALDHILVREVRKTPLLDGYMKSLFSLKSGQYPHELKF